MTLKFTFDYQFQSMISHLGFAKSIILQFIHDESNRGNEFKKLSVDYIHRYVFCISKSLISKTLRDLEKDKLIESKKNKIDKFDRIKYYNITEGSLIYFNILEDFSYEYLGEQKVILENIYYDFNDYKNNIAYRGLSEYEYTKFLLQQR